MSKNIKDTAQRISSGISSGIIIDQFDYKKAGFISQLRNKIRNRLILNQTEAAFLDFKRTEFPQTAKAIYDNLLYGYKRKDKVELMKVLSVPLYDLFRDHLKQGTPLPFHLYKDIVDVSLVQARIYSQHKLALNPAQTWHQMTTKFVFFDPELKQEVTKYNVFERREADPSITDWRICYLE